MDGGYINEGGQLKSKNGQKYIINHRDDRILIKKTHFILICVLIAIVMAALALLTYFIFARSCSGDLIGKQSNGNSDTIQAAGFISHSKQPTESPESDANDISSRAIKLNEGWSPTLYTLIMQPDIVNGTSFGHVIIDIVKDENVNDWPPIVLDINNITIKKAQVFQSNVTLTSPLTIGTLYGENNDTFIIKLTDPSEVKNKTLQVNLKFISQLSDTLQGFYRVNYEDSGTDSKRWLVSTQFSPIDARRAFPCFDRPDKKAQFKISLIRDENRAMAISNMPSVYTSYTHAGYVREDFDVTPKMSTYLVAFMATDLIKTNVSQAKKPADNRLPEINIWSRRNVADMTQFAYDLTIRILPFFEEYFGIGFQLPKIDMVAVPDFGFNAMENWGLITFRESALLVPEDEDRRSSAEHTEHVASILAHELAHQWFGNLVTMKWWDDLWLKEGFATFMDYLVLDKIEPSWRTMDFMSIDLLQKAMAVDSDLNSHPISFAVEKPADIRRIFDPISYSKGAAIIRMMQSYLSEDAFKDAVREYLKNFQYSNAVQDDLWSVMTKYGHNLNTLPKELTVKEIMDSWTLQAGYPVLSITRNGTSISISQHRYLLPQINPNDTQKWYIPITYVTQAKPTHDITIPHVWLSNSTNLTLTNVVDPDHWFYFNVKRSGYYRVNYDRNTWLILAKQFKELPEVILAQLFDDALNLARAEVLEYDIPIFFLLTLRAQDILPWAVASSGIEYLTQMMNREPAYEHFSAIMRYIIKPIYAEMGFEEKSNETHVQLMHRARILQHACFFNYDYCTNKAQVIFREWMRDKTQNLISPNLKGVVYCTALREGSYQEWYFAYARYMKTTSASEKEMILEALGCTTKPWLLAKYLNMTITSTSGIRKQDGARAFMAVANNKVGVEIAFDFLMSNIEQISEYFGDGFSTLSKMIDSVANFMNKDYNLEQINQFEKKAKDLGLKSVEGSIHLAIQKVKNNIFWRSRSYYKLQGFLELLTRDFHINLS